MSSKSNAISILVLLLLVVGFIFLYNPTNYDTNTLKNYSGTIVSVEKDIPLGGYIYNAQYSINNHNATHQLQGVYASPHVIGKDITVYIKDDGSVITDLEISAINNSNTYLKGYSLLTLVVMFILCIGSLISKKGC